MSEQVRKLVYWNHTVIDTDEIAYFSRQDEVGLIQLHIILRGGERVVEQFQGEAVKRVDDIEALIRSHLGIPPFERAKASAA